MRRTANPWNGGAGAGGGGAEVIGPCWARDPKSHVGKVNKPPGGQAVALRPAGAGSRWGGGATGGVVKGGGGKIEHAMVVQWFREHGKVIVVVLSM